MRRLDRAVRQVDDARDFLEARLPEEHARDRVLRERPEALGGGGRPDLPRRRAPRDQLVDLGIELEELHDREASLVADVLAARAADRVEYRPRVVRGHAEELA